MGRRKPGKCPYDYTSGDDGRFADSGVGGTLRVLHGPGQGMGITDGVVCEVEVRTADGDIVDASQAGKFGKEHRLHGTAPGDRVEVRVTGHHEDAAESEVTATQAVMLTGELDDVVRFGIGPDWDDVAARDAGESPRERSAPTPVHWGAGVRLRGARLA